MTLKELHKLVGEAIKNLGKDAEVVIDCDASLSIRTDARWANSGASVWRRIDVNKPEYTDISKPKAKS